MTSLITICHPQRFKAYHPRRFKAMAFSLAAIIAFAIPAAAQHGLSLSSNADFSTKDRLFVAGETIYIKVEPGSDFDATTITESSFEVEPAGDGDEYEGVLSPQDDGSFTGSVEVAVLEGRSTAWHLRVKIEDLFDREYEAREAFVIRGRSNHPNIFRVSGTVEAATDSEISVGGYLLAVTSDTKLHARAEISIADLEGHQVVVSVKKEADDRLTALQIWVKGERDATIDFVGRIQAVGETSIVIRGVEFTVNEHTLLSSHSGELLALSDLELRMRVRVEAQYSVDGWIATSIITKAGGEREDDDDEEEEVKGEIDVIGDGFIEVAGFHLEISDRTKFDGAEGPDDLEVGMEVEVEFVTTEAGVHVATEIKVEDDDEEEEEDRSYIKVEGLITARGDRSITVEGIEFNVTEDTEIKGDGRLEFSDLITGLHVEVEGFVQGDATIARKIEVKGEQENRVVLRGAITALGEGTATVGDTEFQVTDETEIRGERGAFLTFDDLEVDLHALVHLREGGDGSLTALRIKVKRPFKDDDVEITGRIEAVSSTEITVRDHTFSISGDTEIENQKGDEIGAEDLSVGMVAKVEGTIAAEGEWVATEIKVRTRLHHEGRYAGLVTDFTGDVLRVNDVAFLVTAETIVEGANAVGDLAVGTRVKLRFRRLGDGSLLALRIQVKTDDDFEAEVSGSIEEIDGNAIVVAGVDVTVTAATSIKDEDGSDAAFADLEVGQTVEVEGTAAAGGILATKIKIEDGVVVSGAVSDATENTIQLADITFAIDGETFIVGRANAPLTIDDLKAGAYVEVIAGGEASAGKHGSTMKADRVLVIESTATSTSSANSDLPSSFRLEQNYPNPFNPTTNITFELGASAAGHVSLAVFNLLGQHVATLVDGSLSAGTHTYRWDGRHDSGRSAASGLYLYRLRVGDQTSVRAMTLTK